MRDRVQRNINAVLAKALGMLVVCGAIASAQSPTRNNYFRRILNQDQGLNETQVNAIAQTPDGYLWLGTRRGLIRRTHVSPILFRSGGEPAMEMKLAAFGVMLDKPFALEALARAVRGALDDTTK